MTEGKEARAKGARRARGFARAGGLVQAQIRRAGESRGFSESRLVLHWAEAMGEEIAGLCRPVKVSWGRGGLGATLTLLARGGAATLLQARLPQIRDRANACYGYNAISRIRITQTAPAGFAEAQAGYAAAPAASRRRTIPDASLPEAEACTAGVADPALREALAALGTRILTTPRK